MLVVALHVVDRLIDLIQLCSQQVYRVFEALACFGGIQMVSTDSAHLLSHFLELASEILEPFFHKLLEIVDPTYDLVNCSVSVTICSQPYKAAEATLYMMVQIHFHLRQTRRQWS